MTTDELLQVRHFIYRFFLAETRPPTPLETAVHFQLSKTEAEQAYRKLHDDHFLFLNPGTTQIRMANPLSAIPTDYRVRVGDKRYWANCAWDMLGIPAMLGQDAKIEAVYADTGDTAVFRVQNNQVQDIPGVIHFSIPFRAWYDDLILT